MQPADDAPDRFPCPRCAAVTEARFYGPCPTCRSEFVAAQAAGARAALQSGESRARFEPAMHVVPNQVATKE